MWVCTPSLQEWDTWLCVVSPPHVQPTALGGEHGELWYGAVG